MDEEQGLQSPIAGGLRGIRRSVSSGIFGGTPAPVQAQPDSQTTNLLQQNSLALNNVSSQLTNISQQVAGLNGSLAAIQENLAVSDTLERQREAAKQNREAILAEQGLREGKESQIESRIQQALTFPVRRLAQKTQFGLSRLTNFFLILAGGWLTNTLVNMINASADGNTDLFNQLKNTLQKQLLIVGGTMVAISLGFKAILNGIGALAATALRLGRGGLLSVPFLSIANGLKFGTLFYLSGKITPKTGNPVADAVLQGGVIGGLLFAYNKIGDKLGQMFGVAGKKTTEKIIKEGGKKTIQGGAKIGFKGLLRKLAAPFRGKGGFIGSFLIDFLIFGESIDNALVGAAGFVAGAKIGAKIGAAIGAFVGGIGAVPGAFIGGLIGGFLGPDIFKGIYNGIKRLFGFKVKGDDEGDVEGGPGVELDEGAGITKSDDEVFGMRRGGIVPGPRINKDIIPAMLTPGEFVMTKETTDRIGASFFEALNKGGMVDKSITPINKTEANSVADKVSSLEEGAPDVVSFPIAGAGGGADTASDGSGGESTNNIPNIGFNDDNIHTLYATSLYGANT